MQPVKFLRCFNFPALKCQIVRAQNLSEELDFLASRGIYGICRSRSRFAPLFLDKNKEIRSSKLKVPSRVIDCCVDSIVLRKLAQSANVQATTVPLFHSHLKNQNLEHFI